MGDAEVQYLLSQVNHVTALPSFQLSLAVLNNDKTPAVSITRSQRGSIVHAVMQMILAIVKVLNAASEGRRTSSPRPGLAFKIRVQSEIIAESILSMLRIIGRCLNSRIQPEDDLLLIISESVFPIQEEGSSLGPCLQSINSRDASQGSKSGPK